MTASLTVCGMESEIGKTSLNSSPLPYGFDTWID